MILHKLRLNQIKPDPLQPRQSMHADELKGLALSIRDQGQLQPVVAYRNGDDFVLVDGHRRFEACKLLKASGVLAIVLEQRPDADQLLITQLAANCHRIGLNPVERAQAYDRLLQLKNWSQAELANALHISRSQICQIMALLRLPAEAQQAVAQGILSPSTAYNIVRSGDPTTQAALLEQAKTGKLTRDGVQKNGRHSPPSIRPVVRMTFVMRTATVAITAAQPIPPADIAVLLHKLQKDCRQAAAEGLDVKTLERLLADRARAEAASTSDNVNTSPQLANH